MQWNSGYDESVEVNQRALIDKVLARYSGEFTGAFRAVPHQKRQPEHQRVVFRELLQNSDDASSKAVEIRFETRDYIERMRSSEDQAPPLVNDRLPDLKTASVCGLGFSFGFFDLIVLVQVHRWTFKNNGILFRDEDWNRLRKIGAQPPYELTAQLTSQSSRGEPGRREDRRIRCWLLQLVFHHRGTLCHIWREMDGVLLEGQERSGALALPFASVHTKDSRSQVICPSRQPFQRNQRPMDHV